MVSETGTEREGQGERGPEEEEGESFNRYRKGRAMSLRMSIFLYFYISGVFAHVDRADPTPPGGHGTATRGGGDRVGLRLAVSNGATCVR